MFVMRANRKRSGRRVIEASRKGVWQEIYIYTGFPSGVKIKIQSETRDGHVNQRRLLHQAGCF